MEDLEDPDATAVARAATLAAADGLLEGRHILEERFVHAEGLEGGHDLLADDGHCPGAIRAETADESLGDHQLDGGTDEEGFDAHVDEARDGAGRVVGVEGREN